MRVSAATIRRLFLEPGMEARARNLVQQRLLANQTPECDSLVDHLAAIHPDTPEEREHLRALYEIALTLIEENELEGDCELKLTGAADTLVRELRGAELRGGSGVLKAKTIARRLRGPLGVLADPAGRGAMEIVDAIRAVDDVICLVPSAQLFATQVRHELRGRKFDLLRELHARRAGRKTTLSFSPIAAASTRRRRRHSRAALKHGAAESEARS